MDRISLPSLTGIALYEIRRGRDVPDQDATTSPVLANRDTAAQTP